MEWTNVIFWSVFTACAALVLVYCLKACEKLKTQEQTFSQNKELEELKKKNALELMEKRKTEKEELDKVVKPLEDQIKELGKDIENSGDKNKQDLAIAKEKIKLYREFLKLK